MTQPPRFSAPAGARVPEAPFLRQALEKVLLFDGGMGTCIQAFNLSPDDFQGLDGCNELLVDTRPDVIADIHAQYYAAGADVVETNTFGATGIVLAEYDIAERAYELNFKAAKLAREVAASFTDRPRFVAGSIGPTTKLPSLGHIAYADLKASYHEQVSGLIDGGADVLLIETCQDLLQTKAAIASVMAVKHEKQSAIPVMVQVTIETTGTMLVGSDISAVVAVLEPYAIDVLGMNCATGPREMSDHIRYLSTTSPFLISCLPNAGIPENIGGKAHYHLTPPELAEFHRRFVTDLGVGIVGGCCGTTPAHIRAVAEAVGGLAPAPRKPLYTNALTSLYTATPLHVDPGPLMIGERTNANGSKLFRDKLAEDDYDALVDIGKGQVRQGAHLLDVCTAYVGRDEIRDMRETVTRFNSQLDVPLMIDSTEVPVIAEALSLIAGRAIVNSINLEDGEARMEQVLALCKEFGAAVVALTIDEDGMAKSAERKLAVAKRIYDLAVGKYGLKPEDLVFDPLTFTLGSGDDEFRRAGLETLEAIGQIKAALPGVSTLLGVSNISFGLKMAARHVLNSVFLHRAVEAGLDMAIINAQHILPLHRISEEERRLCNDLIDDRRTADHDPVVALMAFYDANVASAAAKADAVLPETVEERLKYRIINGEKTGLEADLAEALARYPALEIINTLLLDGMKTVGELFGRGEMQLPFVLQSAEVMKTAVAYLEPHMEKSGGDTAKGVVVLATVKGDVHDIGKNLVDIILTNNGYRVHNLGIKQPIETILQAFETHGADAIGMSGLLVKSTAIMKENLAIMRERRLDVPVILGGAALTKRFVEEDCQNEYDGRVFYARDAFAGLHAMEEILAAKTGQPLPEKTPALVSASVRVPDGEPVYQAVGDLGQAGLPPDHPDFTRRSDVADDVPVPPPPFWGTKVVTDIPLADIYPYMNVQALIAGQWQVKRGTRRPEEHEVFLQTRIYPVLEAMKARAVEERHLVPRVIYGFFPCQSSGNDLIVYRPEPYEQGETVEWTRFHFPRGGARRLCLADFFASADSGRMDVLAMQVVTVGREATAVAQKLFEANRYQDYLYFHGFSVEMAEALAEYWHKRVREAWGIAGDDAADIRRLLAQGYRGSRYSFGYPACPNLEDQRQLFDLLAPGRIGIALSEEFMLEPEQSTSALIVHHPEARYFDVRTPA